MSVPSDVPAIDHIVAELAEDVEKIMISLYDLQKSPNRTEPLFFANVREELRSHWEGLHTYLQKCYGFGVEVFALKDALAAKGTADLIEFLGDMKTSADKLRDTSLDLKNKSMSETLSKEIDQARPQDRVSRSQSLQAYVSTVGKPKSHKYLGEIAEALGRIDSNFNRMSEFWTNTGKGCDSLVGYYKTGASISTADAKEIISNWKRYQEAITKAIGSITKTDIAILIEPDVEAKPVKARTSELEPKVDTNEVKLGKVDTSEAIPVKAVTSEVIRAKASTSEAEPVKDGTSEPKRTKASASWVKRTRERVQFNTGRFKRKKASTSKAKRAKEPARSNTGMPKQAEQAEFSTHKVKQAKPFAASLLRRFSLPTKKAPVGTKHTDA